MCAGRSSIKKCSAKTVLLLAKALGCSMENLLISDYDASGKPNDKSYLECNLPDFLQQSLNAYCVAKDRQKSDEEVSLMDCYYCELQSDINTAEVNDIVSTEQAWYLREKYLGIER